MKITTLILALLTLNLSAQVNLRFDKRFVECEDKWVAFKMNEDSTYNFGFIYIDEQAGLTLNSEGTFKPISNNKFEVKRLSETNIKARLQPNKVKVAIIPSEMFSELGINEFPEWLIYYKTDTNSTKRLYKWGFMYNGWNECQKGLNYLERAYAKEPKYEGLIVELAYSYNCLNMFEKSIALLEKSLTDHSNDAYYNKEYIYSLSKGNEISKATEQYYKSLEILTDKQYNAENCFNILQYFYNRKDKSNFDKWYKELGNQKTNNQQITDYAKRMKDDLKK